MEHACLADLSTKDVLTGVVRQGSHGLDGCSRIKPLGLFNEILFGECKKQ
jgi:hypothetical protein